MVIKDSLNSGRIKLLEAPFLKRRKLSRGLLRTTELTHELLDATPWIELCATIDEWFYKPEAQLKDR